MSAIGSRRDFETSAPRTTQPAEPDCCTGATVQTAKCCAGASANNVRALFLTSTQLETPVSRAEPRSRGVRGDEPIGGRNASRVRSNF